MTSHHVRHSSFVIRHFQLTYSHDSLPRNRRLREEIREHDRRYYVDAAPKISDLEYDRLLARLKSSKPRIPTGHARQPHAARRRASRSTSLPSVEHRVPMLSIDNTYSVEELRQYGDRVAKLLPASRSSGSSN